MTGFIILLHFRNETSSINDTYCELFVLQVQEAAMLLCMMINYCSEDSRVMLHAHEGLQEVKVKSDIIFDNVRQAMKQVEVRISLLL